MTDHIEFQIAVVMYCCVHGVAPEYLTDLCVPVIGSTLWSASNNQLIVLPVKLSSFGEHTISVSSQTSRISRETPTLT